LASVVGAETEVRGSPSFTNRAYTRIGIEGLAFKSMVKVTVSNSKSGSNYIILCWNDRDIKLLVFLRKNAFKRLFLACEGIQEP